MGWIKSNICFNLNKSNLSNQTVFLWHLSMEIQTTKQQASALDFTLECLPKRLSVLFSTEFTRLPGLAFFIWGLVQQQKTAASFLLKTVEHSLRNSESSELGFYECVPTKPALQRAYITQLMQQLWQLCAQPGPAAGNQTLAFVSPRPHFRQTFVQAINHHVFSFTSFCIMAVLLSFDSAVI